MFIFTYICICFFLFFCCFCCLYIYMYKHIYTHIYISKVGGVICPNQEIEFGLVSMRCVSMLSCVCVHVKRREILVAGVTRGLRACRAVQWPYRVSTHGSFTLEIHENQ